MPGGAAVRAAPVGLCSGIELRGFAVGIVGIGAVLTDIVPGCFVLAAGPDTPPSVSGEVPCSPEVTVPAGFGGCGIIACSFALMGLGGKKNICRGMPSSDAVVVGAIESDT